MGFCFREGICWEDDGALKDVVGIGDGVGLMGIGSTG